MTNKIFENEILSDEQLEQISGGDRAETLCDSKFLYDYGLVSDWHGDFHRLFNWKSDSAEIDDGWRKAGIICVTSFFEYNKYFLNGKQLNRHEAYDVVRENFKRIHKEYLGNT